MAKSVRMDASPQVVSDPARCPLCSELNDCHLCTPSFSKKGCWCVSVKFPEALLSALPKPARIQECVCRNCVESFNAQQERKEAEVLLADDYYIDESGLMVFTSAYHLRRGYCCENDCRHCPYRGATP